ncbi:hypothetical protein E8E11_003624 [Didymella keratinophila]|nr:hypothetical protein E8E11_003624 [Didymella keratinophila]
MASENTACAASSTAPIPLRLGDHTRNGLVSVRIGPDGVTYQIYKTLLTEHSEYFRNTLNGSWKESDDGVIDLDDVDCHIFEIFIHWLHTQRLLAKFSLWLKKDETEPGTKAVQMAMLDTWVFADRFLTSALRRDCEHALVDMFCNRSLPYYEVVIQAYECLPPTSLVLKAMIAAHCERFDQYADNEDNGELDWRNQLPNEFLAGVMMQYMMIKEHGLDPLPVPCQFHEHPQEDWGCTVSASVCINDLALDACT